MRPEGIHRCGWVGSEPLYRSYHDREWGVPVHDDRRLFEFLILEGAITNARSFLKVQEEFGSFDAYQWRFVDGRPIRNAWRSIKEVPASTPVSDAMSRDLKRRGFRFVGSTICYAHMQAVGMVNDHTVDCFRWRELGA